MTKDIETKHYASRSGEFYNEQRENNIRNYKCSVAGCNKAYYNKSQLDAHLLKHSGNKPYRCEHCEYASRQKYLLDKHKEKIHRISLPSTRISRHRERISIPPRFNCIRLTQLTNKTIKTRSNINKRIHLYRNNATSILALVESGRITKNAFYADKSAGYIDDCWWIFNIGCPPLKIWRSPFTARSHTEKLTSVLNQIHSIAVLYGADEYRYTNQLQLFQQDNKAALNIINKGIKIYKQWIK